ncbi:MAG: T9SS type A sorting domain-containing protein [Bacteroidota bacterium]|nr:T9SS type A sorting domain-containing protein [Bacteroidota bacterium]
MAKKYFSRFKTFIISFIAVVLVVCMANMNVQKAEARKFHSPEETARLIDMVQSQPYDTNTFFATGGRCGGCHGRDPNGIAMVSDNGTDVNIMDGWQGTMMANSAKDPFWRAKVSHEILVNPGLQVAIEDKCTSCHAPTGHFTAHMFGQPNYTMARLATDSFGLDGVNCSGCHQQIDTLMGNNFSGNLHYSQKVIYGPVQNPYSAVMEFFVEFRPEYSLHTTESEFCGGCHTLQTETVDLAGIPTGGSFVEQATFHEWKNSSYSTNGASCQSCHLPRLNDSIRLATDYPFVPERSPYGQHVLVGGNAFMLKLMKNNMTAVGATCEPANFDTTIARTMRYLRDSTCDMHVIQTARTTDTVYFDVQLDNKAGHKFPSGYPSRIAWVQFVVTDNIGDTIYKSGLQDAFGNIIGRDAGFEPHHDVCYTNNDVQIYEMVMGDVADNPTTVLQRADTCLKDNRLCPKGFSTSHPSYDTTKVIGIGVDPDFNYSGPTEGTGGDVVHYHVFINGYGGTLNLSTKLYYTAVPRQWLSEMFAFSSPEITNFQGMFNTADQTPMLIAQVDYQNTITSADMANGYSGISVYPNPSANGHLNFSGYEKSGLQMVHVYDLAGKEVMPSIPGATFTGAIDLPKRGVYLIVMETKAGRVVKKVMW